MQTQWYTMRSNTDKARIRTRRCCITTDPEALMADGARRIVAGVHHLAAPWVENAVMRVVQAWARLDQPTRVRVRAEAAAAGATAATRVEHELEALFALDVEAQRTTPLAVVRSLRVEATEVLRAAGIPEVERDPYDVRAFPDDIYGIVPKSITELGDEDLGGALLAWGVGKARVLRDRKNPGAGVES
jgi:hypothetical protein